MPATPEEVLDFWFADCTKSPEALQRRVAVWFARSAEFDRTIQDLFGDLPDLALSGAQLDENA